MEITMVECFCYVMIPVGCLCIGVFAIAIIAEAIQKRKAKEENKIKKEKK